MTAPDPNPNPAPDSTGKRGALKLASAALAAAVAAAIGIGVLHNPSSPAPLPAAVATTVGIDATHSITVAPDDSGNVLVTVLGYSYPLVASQTGNMARAWATDVDSAASVPVSTDANAQPVDTTRQEYVHNSDALRYQRSVDGQHIIAIDIGPNDLTLYQATVSRATVDSLTTAIRAASKTP